MQASLKGMNLMCDRSIGVHYGLGRHAIVLKQPAAFAKVCIVLKCSFIDLLADFNPAECTRPRSDLQPRNNFLKVSILLLYRRIFPSRSFRYVTLAVGIFVVSYSITAATVNIFQCIPVKSDWDPQVKPRCVNIGVDLIILSSISVVTDAAILCLPIQQLWHLKMSRIRNFQIGGLFLSGGMYVRPRLK